MTPLYKSGLAIDEDGKMVTLVSEPTHVEWQINDGSIQHLDARIHPDILGHATGDHHRAGNGLLEAHDPLQRFIDGGSWNAGLLERHFRCLVDDGLRRIEFVGADSLDTELSETWAGGDENVIIVGLVGSSDDLPRGTPTTRF